MLNSKLNYYKVGLNSKVLFGKGLKYNVKYIVELPLKDLELYKGYRA